MSQLESYSSRQYLVAALGGLAVALAASGAWVAFSAPRNSSAQLVAMQTPDFDLQRLDGSAVRLSQQTGKVVLIDFWATWCGPCRDEMPWLVSLAKRFESRGVVFIAINEDDPPGQTPLVAEFTQVVPGLERYAVLGNPAIESTYGVTSLPTLFVIDRRGRLIKTLVGSADERALTALVDQLSAL